MASADTDTADTLSLVCRRGRAEERLAWITHGLT